MRQLLLGSGGIVLVLAWLALFVLAFGWPLATWWAARSLSGIRRELARMNDNLERQSIVEGDVRPFVKTGSLNIR